MPFSPSLRWLPAIRM